MKTILLACLLILLSATNVAAQRSTRRGLHAAKTEPVAAKSEAQTSAIKVDTIVNPEKHTLDINGYDKPLRSRRETFFVTNNGSRDIEAFTVTIDYLDSSRRQLHRATHHITTDVPAGQTRQVSLPSWDKQQSFYYVRSAVPRRAEGVSPFDVTIDVDTIFACPNPAR